MAELDATRHSGWSYSAGWNQDFRAYHARAWKQRERPYTVPSGEGKGVVLYLHTVSSTAPDLEAAAIQCASKTKSIDEVS